MLLYKVVIIFKNLYFILLKFSEDKYVVKYFLDNRLRIY